jgi:predicted nuclease of predicted toxin-antitoxin system
MEIIIDECIAQSTRLILAKAELKIINVEDILQAGAEDELIFNHAYLNKTPIITHDRRFGEIYYFSHLEPPTIIILQILSPHPDATNQLLTKFLTQFDLTQTKYFGKLILITKNKIRIRTKKI